MHVGGLTWIGGIVASMQRNVVVMSNCQTGGLAATLRQMLPDDRVDATMWLGFPPTDLDELVARADVLVTSLERDEAGRLLAERGSSAQLVIVPSLYFEGFHPDLGQFGHRDGTEVLGAVGPYHSRLLMWGWVNGMSPEALVASFNPDTFAALGYTSAWDASLEVLRQRFDGTDLDFDAWYLAVVRRGAFMLTNNHPRLDALVEMARGVGRILGAERRLVAYDWGQVIPDGLLATAAIWPVYPGIAEVLDLPGAYVWRLASGEIIGLERFVAAGLEAYATMEPDSVDIDGLRNDPRYADVLGASTRVRI